MITTVRQLYASVTTSTDNAANLTIVKRGVISAVHILQTINTVTDNANAQSEISFFPVFQGTTNDPNGPIFSIATVLNVLTSGIYEGVVRDSIGGIAIPVEPGMKVYINTSNASVSPHTVLAQIYVTTS